MGRKIKIKICDFWNGFDVRDNIFVDMLNEEYECEFSDEPDYIIYSDFGDEFVKYDGVRIHYTGENIRSNFNLCDYGIGFDYLEFGDRYCRFPLYEMKNYGRDYNRACNKHLNVESLLKGKTKFCSYVYGNAEADPRREAFFHLLSKYKKVDSGGRHLNNIGGSIGFGEDSKYLFQKDYKFAVVFENSSTPGYVTEKITQAFAAGTVPIYWGDPLIVKGFNEKSFINCHSFDSFDAVVEHVKFLDGDMEAYEAYLREPMHVETYTSCQIALRKQLLHIVGQEKELAYRRERFATGKKYQERYIQEREQIQKHNRSLITRVKRKLVQ